MEILDNQVVSSSENTLTDRMRELLITTAKWGRFLSIVGFVAIGLLIVMLFSLGTIFSTLNSQPGMPMGMDNMESFLMFPFAILIAIYFFPTLYLYQFSSNTLKGIAQPYDVIRMETAFEKLKSLFKFMGIFTIVILSIYGLFFLVIALGAATR